MKHVIANIVAVEKQSMLHIVSVRICVCLALFIQHAMRVRHVVFRVLPRSAVFFHIMS